jgi:diadenosine tetraphosphatase ApaH/serine/threonine PP2A family protein phosphatase
VSGLPRTLVRGDFTLAHGSPRDPVREYLDTPWAARQNLEHFSTTYCAVGHTHQPVVFNCTADVCRARHLVPDGPVVLGEERVILNPGGVGQPRDGDPRASYAIYDDDARQVRLHRVLYDVPATQRKMQAHGLPTRLIARLSYGF